jgi:RNA polymerase sigma-70 factor, ECF subfamily
MVSALADGMALAAADDGRLRAAVQAHTAAVWRVLRRNGVPAAEADDAVQRVFVVLSRRMEAVDEGGERAFLMRTATLIASETRRTIRRRRETGEAMPELPLNSALPDELCAQREAIVQLDGVLDAMDESLRAVFVLYELEEMTMAEISETLELPPGTVASRLRRARACFEELCTTLRRERP